MMTMMTCLGGGPNAFILMHFKLGNRGRRELFSVTVEWRQMLKMNPN